MTKTKTYTTGAKRSDDVEGGYHLIPPEGLRRLAGRFLLGAKKRGVNNWKKGMPASDVVDHMQVHLTKYANGDRTDDHLGAVAWGCFALAYFEENMPEMIDLVVEGVIPDRRNTKST
jgi:hypothetical protein